MLVCLKQQNAGKPPNAIRRLSATQSTTEQARRWRRVTPFASSRLVEVPSGANAGLSTIIFPGLKIDDLPFASVQPWQADYLRAA